MSPSDAPSPTPPAADRPAHYRLGTATWELILKEYREGATAPFLSRKWRVSEHAVRRRITQHGATKRDWGDAQAIEQALAREAELEEARRNSPEAVAARLFAGIASDGEGAGDPAVLAREATLASGRAMKGRLWAEAKALAGLAESYARLAATQGRTAGAASGAGGGEMVPLAHVARAILDDAFACELMRIDPDDPDPNPVRSAFWERNAYQQWCAMPDGNAFLKSAGMRRGDPALRPDAPWPAG
jgi:hypothetical protein